MGIKDKDNNTPDNNLGEEDRLRYNLNRDNNRVITKARRHDLHLLHLRPRHLNRDKEAMDIDRHIK